MKIKDIKMKDIKCKSKLIIDGLQKLKIKIVRKF